MYLLLYRFIEKQLLILRLIQNRGTDQRHIFYDNRIDIMEKFTLIKNNPSLEGSYRITPNVVYRTIDGQDLKLHVIHPWTCEQNENLRQPLILFIQGSAWTHPDMYSAMPALAWYASFGYTVATVDHRNCADGYTFPAYLEDVKCALRFLRAHAAEYRIDPEKVIAYGTSSGGNTALLLGMTGDDPKFKTEEYAEYSDSVSAVAECFGPTDFIDFANTFEDNPIFAGIVLNIVGGRIRESQEAARLAREMSPFHIAEAGRDYPPFLILHGTGDWLVNYDSNGKALFDKLDSFGYDVSLVTVENGDHEGNFWSREVHETVLRFFREKIK